VDALKKGAEEGTAKRIRLDNIVSDQLDGLGEIMDAT
jgi:hypothetical protein